MQYSGLPWIWHTLRLYQLWYATNCCSNTIQNSYTSHFSFWQIWIYTRKHRITVKVIGVSWLKVVMIKNIKNIYMRICFWKQNIYNIKIIAVIGSTWRERFSSLKYFTIEFSFKTPMVQDSKLPINNPKTKSFSSVNCN